jgi:hypothetical protein
MEGLGFGRPRTDEQIVRGSVSEELGPFFREAPMEQVDDAFTALGRTDGGEDLIRRLEASGPRAEYSIDLPGDTRAVTQADTSVPPTFRTRDIRRAHSQARDNWPAPYDASAEEIMDPAYFASFSPAEQRVLRELSENDWLGFDYPSQAMNAVLTPGSPSSWEMSPGLRAARGELISPRARPITEGGQGYSVSDLPPGTPAGPPPRGFPAPFAEPRGLVPQGPRGLVPQERGLIPRRRELSVPGESLGDAPLRLEGPEQLRLEGPRQPRLEGPEQLRIEGPQRARIEGPGVSAERNAMDDLAAAVDADAARRRVPRDGDFRLSPAQRQAAMGVGGALAAAAGAGVALRSGELGDSEAMGAEPKPYRPVPNVMRPPRTTADLAAEQNPPPSVMTQEPEVVDYSAMARDKIRQANEIQRREGRVTPESAALTREADALYRRSADERSAGRGQPIMPSEQANAQTSAVRAEGQRQIRDNPGEDYHSQARRLMGRMNSGEFRSPAEYSAAKREVDRLFALGDAQRNSRR